MHRIQALPEGGKFGNRVSICAAYRGQRGEALNAAAGVTDAEFVHAAGFIGGAWSLESVIKMAEASHAEHNALKEEEKKKKEEEALLKMENPEKKQKIEGDNETK